MGSIKNVPTCKVCNSKLRHRIQELYIAGLSPEKIWEHMQGLDNINERAIVMEENISAASIRRHLKKHFNTEEEAKVKIAETRSRAEESREQFHKGVQIVVDKINSLNYLIEKAILNIEDLEKSEQKSKHTNIIGYMGQVKSLIETLSKLTGELKQEGTIDIHFFNTEIEQFADIVMAAIRQMDEDFDMNGQLEQAFSERFTEKWDEAQSRRKAIAQNIPRQY